MKLYSVTFTNTKLNVKKGREKNQLSVWFTAVKKKSKAPLFLDLRAQGRISFRAENSGWWTILKLNSDINDLFIPLFPPETTKQQYYVIEQNMIYVIEIRINWTAHHEKGKNCRLSWAVVHGSEIN